MSEQSPAPKSEQAKPSSEGDGAFPPIEPSARSAPPSPIRKGAKWGALAGLMVAQLHIRNNSPLGFYTGSMMLVFAICIGLGAAIGAGIACISTRSPPDDEWLSR